ncbi:uncharacterized protein LOC129304741 [Prosopis cineraria]|uniref:uncharacterized protein LOC129304741 n=1 Tax=Prosopis cineraria TaxID=364024 RepID=UPI00240FDD79|nr:uncharacterized protein LOC129304741 [Prosopis cineraria]
MIKYGESQVMTVNPIFRSESLGYCLPEQSYSMMEKRQLFLRSYQFCRKKSVAERIKGSLARAKKAVWLSWLRSALGLRKLVFSRFQCGFHYRRRRFFRLFNVYPCRRSDSCFF